MQFGLKNAPAIFQRMMNTQFADIIAQGNIIIYFDDILIATDNNLETHRRVVGQVLDWLQKLNLYLKPNKCIFETRRIEFLGVVLEMAQSWWIWSRSLVLRNGRSLPTPQKIVLSRGLLIFIADSSPNFWKLQGHLMTSSKLSQDNGSRLDSAWVDCCSWHRAQYLLLILARLRFASLWCSHSLVQTTALCVSSSQVGDK